MVEKGKLPENYKEILEILKKVFEGEGLKGKIICEIGPASPFFIDYLNRLEGARAYGVDPDPISEHPKIIAGRFEEHEPEEKVDAAFSSGVLDNEVLVGNFISLPEELKELDKDLSYGGMEAVDRILNRNRDLRKKVVRMRKEIHENALNITKKDGFIIHTSGKKKIPMDGIPKKEVEFVRGLHGENRIVMRKK